MTATPWHTPPGTDEYEPYYATYIGRVPAGDFLANVRAQTPAVVSFFESLPPEKVEHAYAPGKWTMREVLGHLIDTERIFSYRALSFSRADPSPLPGFDQAAWKPEETYAGRSLASLVAEWQAVRHSFLAFAEGLPPAYLDRRGQASGRTFSVRALLWIPPGHAQYHLEHLREHYL